MSTRKLSPRKAIDEMCKDCIYDELVPGSWRKQVENCPCTDCPLWEHRPVTTEKRSKKSRSDEGKSTNKIEEVL